MTDFFRRNLVFFAISLFFMGIAVAAVPQPPAETYVQYVSPSAYQPPAVVIFAEMPDKGLVCVGPRTGGGLSACREIEEFRRWVKERPKK